MSREELSWLDHKAGWYSDFRQRLIRKWPYLPRTWRDRVWARLQWPLGLMRSYPIPAYPERPHWPGPSERLLLGYGRARWRRGPYRPHGPRPKFDAMGSQALRIPEERRQRFKKRRS